MGTARDADQPDDRVVNFAFGFDVDVDEGDDVDDEGYVVGDEVDCEVGRRRCR